MLDLPFSCWCPQRTLESIYNIYSMYLWCTGGPLSSTVVVITVSDLFSAYLFVVVPFPTFPYERNLLTGYWASWCGHCQSFDRVDVPIHSDKAGLCYRKGEKGDRTGEVNEGNAKAYNESKKQKCKNKSRKHKTKAKTVVAKVKTHFRFEWIYFT